MQKCKQTNEVMMMMIMIIIIIMPVIFFPEIIPKTLCINIGTATQN
jgi:CBS domain containing-hemolysin-like protein